MIFLIYEKYLRIMGYNYDLFGHLENYLGLMKSMRMEFIRGLLELFRIYRHYGIHLGLAGFLELRIICDFLRFFNRFCIYGINGYK